MRSGLSRLRGAATVALLFIGACASSGTSTDATATAGTGAAATADPSAMPIMVMNQYVNSERITVYIEPVGGGARELLGVVADGERKTFTFAVPTTGSFQLVAQTGSGFVTSPRFTNTGSNKVEWDRSINKVVSTKR
jgi:hypothetical protein